MGVQDRDWYREAHARREGRLPQINRLRSLHPATGAALSIIGALLFLAIGVSLMQWRARVALDEVMGMNQESAQSSQVQMQQVLRDEAVRQAQRQAQIQQQEAMRFKAIAERQRDDEDLRRAAVNAVDRKAKAWARFYRKPATCEDVATMECANNFIRARRTFEEKYARGEL